MKFNLNTILTTTYLAIIQIQESIPKKWMKVLKQNVYAVPVLNIKNHLHINNSKMELEKVKCKDIYWHLINNITHMPKAIIAWENVYTRLKNKEDKVWKTLFTIAFISTRDTRLQSFQYKILHGTLPCNEWLKTSK